MTTSISIRALFVMPRRKKSKSGDYETKMIIRLKQTAVSKMAMWRVTKHPDLPWRVNVYTHTGKSEYSALCVTKAECRAQAERVARCNGPGYEKPAYRIRIVL